MIIPYRDPGLPLQDRWSNSQRQATDTMGDATDRQCSKHSRSGDSFKCRPLPALEALTSGGSRRRKIITSTVTWDTIRDRGMEFDPGHF
jgi:hypothetical protein